jgi:hypothetical protein
MSVNWRVSYKNQELLTLREHPRLFGGGPCAHLFSYLCCTITCLYALSFVLWCSLRFQHKNDVGLVLTSSCLYEGSCLINVICVCLRIVMSSTCCVLFVVCILCFQFLWIVHFWVLLRYSLTFICQWTTILSITFHSHKTYIGMSGGWLRPSSEDHKTYIGMSGGWLRPSSEDHKTQIPLT